MNRREKNTELRGIDVVARLFSYDSTTTRGHSNHVMFYSLHIMIPKLLKYRKNLTVAGLLVAQQNNQYVAFICEFSQWCWPM
jgi:hypothetical protein